MKKQTPLDIQRQTVLHIAQTYNFAKKRRNVPWGKVYAKRWLAKRDPLFALRQEISQAYEKRHNGKKIPETTYQKILETLKFQETYNYYKS